MFRRSFIWSRYLFILFALILLCSMSVFGATYTVTTTADAGVGSLRDAINLANANPGNDNIIFNIPGTGPHTIFPLSQLPQLIDPTGVFIDGKTQPGTLIGASPPSSLVLMIEIDGANTGGSHGLWIISDNNVIDAICVSNFEYDGIRIEGGIINPQANFNTITNCIVGTDITGTSKKGNGRAQNALWAGVSIQNVANGFCDNNTVDHSLISANYAEGVHVTGPIQPGQVQSHIISDCYIGTDISGTIDLGNIHEGVCLSEGTILNLVSNNIISGNDYDGVGIQGFDNTQYEAPPIQTDYNTVADNIIGLDVNLNPLGNTMHGVAIGEYGPSQWGCAANNDIIGNTISDNGGDGVAVWEHWVDAVNADNNHITMNNIYNNIGLGIDLQNNGVTPNDVGDPDEGPNIYLNRPIIDSAIYTATSTTVYGTIDIDSDPTLAIPEIFYVSVADPSGTGEGDQFLGFSNTPDAAGKWTFTTSSLNAGDLISATVSDYQHNSSEFSYVGTVTGGTTPTGACCYPDGSCGTATAANCTQAGGTYLGDGTTCFGDSNGNGMDDACEALDVVHCEPQGGQNPTHPPTYWYDVTPGSVAGLCNFHVKVYDSILTNYSNWVAPAGWSHTLHKVGSDWYVSWYDPGCGVPITSTFRFQFDNNNPSIWSDWVTTFSGTSDPTNGVLDNSANHVGEVDGLGYRIHVPFLEETEIDTCDYYKSPYEDYAPYGMPDFDQKQNSWYDLQTLKWTHCGPTALANCFWWFDSKFESSVTPPPVVIDNYPLVTSFGGPPWDDHDPNNVIPFVDSLALYCNTNPPGQTGTYVMDLANGASNWLVKTGLQDQYTVNLFPIDGAAYDFERLREDVLISQDVILLLGFWQELEPGLCGDRIGGHYVTVAGTCTDFVDSAICISDPYFDANEGEPPAGSAHSSSIHNDAQYISGPHGTINHDKYYFDTLLCYAGMAPQYTLELRNYPVNSTNVSNFYGQNLPTTDQTSSPPSGLPIKTIIEWAVVICPVEGDTCAQQMPGDADGSGIIDTNDVVYLSNYLYAGGPAPSPLANGDVDGKCTIDLRDLICLSKYIATGDACRVSCTCVNPDVTNPTVCCYGMTGNIDYDLLDQVDISDLLYLVDYMFLSPPGTAPPCMDETNVDGSGPAVPDISDLLYLVDYMFTVGAPYPVNCPY